MRTIHRAAISKVGSALLMTLIFVGCSARTTLLVDYHTPTASSQLKGQEVILKVRDVRDDPHLFTANASKDFQAFRNSYDLTLISSDQQRTRIGEKDLQGLFSEVFNKRLALLGAEVSEMDGHTTPQLQILINKFKIDLRDKKWITSVSYEANLSIDNQLVARERVTGSAERLKIMGTKGADKTLSDIFTDIINQFDIVKLFEQAKML